MGMGNGNWHVIWNGTCAYAAKALLLWNSKIRA